MPGFWELLEWHPIPNQIENAMSEWWTGGCGQNQADGSMYSLILPHIHFSESLMLIAKPKQLMRVMRKHNLVNKKTTTKTMTKTMTNTYREHHTFK